MCVLYRPEGATRPPREPRVAAKVDCAKIITRQAQSNCWFNTMFVMFFISDKGRKFFSTFAR